MPLIDFLFVVLIHENLVGILLELIETDFISLGCQVLVESQKNMVEFLDLIRLLDYFRFKLNKLWNAHTIEFFEIIVLGKPRKMPPDFLAILQC